MSSFFPSSTVDVARLALASAPSTPVRSTESGSGSWAHVGGGGDAASGKTSLLLVEDGGDLYEWNICGGAIRGSDGKRFCCLKAGECPSKKLHKESKADINRDTFY